VNRGELLNDLRTAAMAVHVAESADVHEDVEAKICTGMEGAECFVVLAAVTQAKFNDFRNLRARKPETRSRICR